MDNCIKNMPQHYTFVNIMFSHRANCFPMFTSIAEKCKRGVTGPAITETHDARSIAMQAWLRLSLTGF